MARKRFILDKWLEEKKLDKILPGGGIMIWKILTNLKGRVNGMKHMKKRLALFLCLLLTMPTILGCLPMASLKAEAANVPSIYLRWAGGYKGGSSPYPGVYAFEVENGKEVLINKLVYFRREGSAPYFYDYIYMLQVAGESYKSSSFGMSLFPCVLFMPGFCLIPHLLCKRHPIKDPSGSLTVNGRYHLP